MSLVDDAFNNNNFFEGKFPEDTISGAVENEEPIKKEPLGVKPRRLIDENRLIDIKAAIVRRINDPHKIPIEWVEEYNETVERLKQFKQEKNNVKRTE